VIYFVSTMHRASLSTPCTVKRKTVTGDREDVVCPPLLPDYQEFMRGVDRGDQLIGYYNVGRRSVKWWKRVFSYLIETSILNAYVLDKMVVPARNRDTFDFRSELAHSLVGSFTCRKRIGRPVCSTENLDRLDASRSHLVTAAARKRRCAVCSRKGARHESILKCKVCNLHFCVTADRDCFVKYHTFINYWLWTIHVCPMYHLCLLAPYPSILLQ
jgi:hypothetical protein